MEKFEEKRSIMSENYENGRNLVEAEPLRPEQKLKIPTYKDYETMRTENELLMKSLSFYTGHGDGGRLASQTLSKIKGNN